MSKRSDEGAMDIDDSTGTNAWTQVAQRYYEPDGTGELTTAIIYAIATAEGVAPIEVKSPPLYDSVDVPAIENAFFGQETNGEARQGVGTVEFPYDDYLVKVTSEGWIHIYEPSDAERV